MKKKREDKEVSRIRRGVVGRGGKKGKVEKERQGKRKR